MKRKKQVGISFSTGNRRSFVLGIETKTKRRGWESRRSWSGTMESIREEEELETT